MNDSVLSTGNWMQKKSGKEKIKLCMKGTYRAVNEINYLPERVFLFA